MSNFTLQLNHEPNRISVLQLTDSHLFAEESTSLLGVRTASSFKAVLSSILNQELMCRIAHGFGENMYIIPADIDACMLVAESDLPQKDVQEILDCSNRFSLVPEKKLSDHIYYFDREKKEIRQLARPEEKIEKRPIQVPDKGWR